jgi:hypothetical protein
LSFRKLNIPILLGILALFLEFGFASKNLATWPARIGYPGEESYEGIPLAEMARLQRGIAIYAPPSREGFADATYGPLYYLLGSHLIDANHPSYLPLRLLSALATLGLAAGGGVLTFWVTRSRLAALLSPLMFLSYAFVSRQGTSALSDSVALLLFFSGFLVSYHFRHDRRLLWACPLIGLGYFYKPQYIAGPIAMFLFLVLEKRYRQAAEFAGLLGACLVSLFASFQWVVFPGQAFWRHFFTYQGLLLTWPRFTVWLVVFAIMLLVPTGLSVRYLGENRDKLLACYLSCVIPLALVTISKTGSGVHYLLNAVLALSVLAPALLAKRLAQEERPVGVVAALGYTLLVGQALAPPPPHPADLTQYQAVESFLRQHASPGSRALGVSTGDLAQAGLETPFSALYTFTVLNQRGLVSESHLVDAIRLQKFAVILLDFDLGREQDPVWLNYYLTAAMREAIAREYEVNAVLQMPSPEYLNGAGHDHFYVMTPRSSRPTDPGYTRIGRPELAVSP